MITERDLIEFPAVDRLLILEEAQADPAFGGMIEMVLTRPGGARIVSVSARKAAANQLNPSVYPESKGEWPVLRREIERTIRELPDTVDKAVTDLPVEAKIQIAESIRAGDYGVSVLYSIGQDTAAQKSEFEIIGSIFSSVAKAAGDVYATKIQTSAQKDVAKIQQQVEAMRAQVTPLMTAAPKEEFPIWAIILPVALGIVGTLIYLVIRSNR